MKNSMKPVIKDMKPIALKNDLDFWLDILQLWRSHLAFFEVRLKGLSQTKGIPLSDAELDYFLADINRLGETILADYQESLRTDLTLWKEHAQFQLGAEYEDEHDLFEGQMRQLRNEYNHLLQRIMAILEPQKQVA